MLWNVKQVAEYLNISSSMVYKLVGNFELQAIRVGDCIRFSPEAGKDLFAITSARKESVIILKNFKNRPLTPIFNPTT